MWRDSRRVQRISKSEQWHEKFPSEAQHGGFTLVFFTDKCPIQAKEHDVTHNSQNSKPFVQ